MDAINVVSMVDNAIADCLAANLTPYPRPIAETLTFVLYREASAEAQAIRLIEMHGLVLERLQLLDAQSTQPVN